MANVNNTKLALWGIGVAVVVVLVSAAHLSLASEDSQPSCYEMSVRNANSHILCRGQHWYGGAVVDEKADTLPAYPINAKRTLPVRDDTSSGAGAVALIGLIVIIVFVVALTRQNRQTVKRSFSQPEMQIQISMGGDSFVGRKSSVSPDSVWVPQGRSVEVAGYTVPCGLIYVGRGLCNVQGWSVEPALIDPSLPVDKDSSVFLNTQLAYWPTYGQISPASRNAYLQWLAGGCKDPAANIGYVFLYFYGLERRAVADAENSSTARQEVEPILAEVKRLRSIYNSPSFLNYTAGFINAIESKLSKDKLYKNPPSFETNGYELPFALKKALAQLAADNVPVPSCWALAWAENDPGSRLRTPAYRCKSEFQKLFHIRYAEKFNQGLVLDQKGCKLRGSYRPASASFGRAVEWTEDGLLDVSTYRGPINQLSKIAEECVVELDPYSRCLGKSGNNPSILTKLALLPAPLLKDCQDHELQDLNQWFGENINPDKFFLTDVKSIKQYFPSLKSEIFDKRDFLCLCQLLAKNGVGIEPDVRFGGVLSEDGPVVLFQLPKDSASAPSPEYTSATLVLQLATAVAASDGQVSEQEGKHLETQLEMQFKFGPEEKTRLRAHMQWLRAGSSNFLGIKKRLESFNKPQREILGRFLVSIAQLDGYIAPGEIKVLNKIYGLLGLDSKELYSDVHTAATEPVKIEDAEPQPLVFALPKVPRKKMSPNVALDMSKIDVKLAETAAVAAMLSSIFTEEKVEVPSAKATQPEVVGKISYFESEHHGFIKELLQKLSWTRVDLEALAAKSNLLLDGALDSINEAAFTAFNEPFFEGGDPIEINPTVLKELQA